MKITRNIPHLLTRSGLAALRLFIDRSTLFAFDLDGTLAGITADPRQILIPEQTRVELSRLITEAAVAVITGRSRDDACTRLGITPRFLVGNHGAEGLPYREKQEKEFAAICADWEQQLRGAPALAAARGIVIENKGATISIHYRAAPRQRVAQSLILEVVQRLAPAPRRVGGKCVENLIPPTAPDKGVAMLYLMALSESTKGFYIGDDTTDEDVFRLSGENLFTVRVGTGKESLASYELKNHREVPRLLREIREALGGNETIAMPLA